jgi:opacity protein-like surface antigen/outer membrane protein OmpA-like peptidoglycan-associated protein
MKGKWFAAVLVSLLALTQGLMAQKVEVGPYGGGSFFSNGQFKTSTPNPNTELKYNFVDGGVFGIRLRENLSEHFGLEQSFTFLGNNNAQFPGALLGTRIKQFYFNGNLIGYDNESKIRPYFSGGIGVGLFRPTEEAKANGGDLGISVEASDKFQFNYGAGLKFRLSDHFGLDFSVRDFVGTSPTYGFPGASDERWLHNLQLQGGFMLYFGGMKPPIIHTFNVGPAIEAGKTSLCPGETTTLKVSASDSIPENRLTYKWTVKGQEVQATGSEYQFTAPGTPGDYEVGVQAFYDTAGLDKRALKAVKKNPGAPADRKITISVKEDPPPQASASADRSSVRRGERVRLTGNGTCSECSGAPSYRWSVDQGRLVSGADQASAELDTSALSFSETTQGRQEKKITATLEVTCSKTGAKATATQQITVTYQAAPPPPPPAPKAIQLSDINFAQNSSRVNNCAKRILANELYSQMTDARYRDYDIVLVGHQDASEKKTVPGKKKSSLDRERVLNTAAFLSGKGDTCKDIELSRIKASWVAAEQSSEFKSNFCDASTQEKKSDAISNADEKAKNRRVEIWLVPKGAELPAGSGSVQELPRDEVVAKGCPK